jgi:hypothetical protein
MCVDTSEDEHDCYLCKHNDDPYESNKMKEEEEEETIEDCSADRKRLSVDELKVLKSLP